MLLWLIIVSLLLLYKCVAITYHCHIL